MKQQVTKIFSVLMFAVFIYGTAPREYLHDLLTHHIDTVDEQYKKGEFSISTKHVHCAFLSIEFGAFLATEKQFLSFEHVVHYSKWIAADYFYHFSSTHKITSLRGPPVC